MGRLAFLADEHVNRAYVSVLRSSGYRVDWFDGDEYEEGCDGEVLLARAKHYGLVTITNDGDFVELANRTAHT